MKKLSFFVLYTFLISSCAIFNKSEPAILKEVKPVSIYNLDLPMDSIISLDVSPNQQFEFSLKHIETDIDSNSVLFVGATIEGKDIQNANTFLAYPSLFLEDSLIYTFPDTVNNSTIQISMKQEFLDKIFNRITELEYKEFELKKGGAFSFNGYVLTLESLNNKPKYKNEKDDIAASAILNISNAADSILLTTAEPIYYIRKMKSYSMPDYIDEAELFLRFVKIDPVNEIFTFNIAAYRRIDSYPLEVQINNN